MAFDEYMHGKEHTLPTRYEAMRQAIEAAAPPRNVAMCETCFTSWPINNAPAVCPVCNKGRAQHA